MAIIFTDWNAVEVDGIAAGDIVSVLSNYSSRKAEILKAFRDFRTSEKDDRQAKVTKAETDLAAKVAEHKTAIDAAKEEKRTAIDLLRKEKQDAFAEARKELDELKTLLGGEEVVKAKLREARREKIRAEKEEMKFKQDALDAEEAALA